jgi:hypothetical protein
VKSGVGDPDDALRSPSVHRRFELQSFELGTFASIPMTDFRRISDDSDIQPASTMTPRLAPVVHRGASDRGEIVFALDQLSIFYSEFRAVRDMPTTCSRRLRSAT